MPRNVPGRFDGDHPVEVLVCGLVRQPVHADAGIVVGKMQPPEATTCAPSASLSAARDTSHATNPACPSACVIAATVWPPPARRDWRSATITAAPSRATRIAQAGPIPLAAPVPHPRSYPGRIRTINYF